MAAANANGTGDWLESQSPIVAKMPFGNLIYLDHIFRPYIYRPYIYTIYLNAFTCFVCIIFKINLIRLSEHEKLHVNILSFA